MDLEVAEVQAPRLKPQKDSEQRGRHVKAITAELVLLLGITVTMDVEAVEAELAELVRQLQVDRLVVLVFNLP